MTNENVRSFGKLVNDFVVEIDPKSLKSVGSSVWKNEKAVKKVATLEISICQIRKPENSELSVTMNVFSKSNVQGWDSRKSECESSTRKRWKVAYEWLMKKSCEKHSTLEDHEKVEEFKSLRNQVSHQQFQLQGKSEVPGCFFRSRKRWGCERSNDTKERERERESSYNNTGSVTRLLW